MFAGNFAPQGWAFCDGSLMAISSNDVLFQLIGTTYGGDGQSTFALPDLRGRAPTHQGTNPATGTTYIIGQLAGVETVTLTLNQIPIHNHLPLAAAAGTGNPVNSASNSVWSGWTGGQFSGSSTPGAVLNSAAISSAGGSQPHDNMVPFLVINFIISLFGVFPSQT
jgi:microcystin-dependent protein